MTNTLLIAPGVFNQAKPGIDVFSAALSQLQFSGDMGTPARFFQGSLSGSVSGPGTTSHTELFGKSFSTPPFCMVNVLSGSGTSFPGQTYIIKSFGDSNTPWTNFAFSWVFFKVNVKVDRIEFKMTSAGTSFSYAINYLIFDYRLGF